MSLKSTTNPTISLLLHINPNHTLIKEQLSFLPIPSIIIQHPHQLIKFLLLPTNSKQNHNHQKMTLNWLNQLQKQFLLILTKLLKIPSNLKLYNLPKINYRIFLSLNHFDLNFFLFLCHIAFPTRIEMMSDFFMILLKFRFLFWIKRRFDFSITLDPIF